MTGEGHHHCRSCKARLRRGRAGALCDPCARAARTHVQCPVAEGFYDTPVLRAALASYDFGPVFRAVRQAGSLSQEELGVLVELSQARVSDVERGAHRLQHVAVIARVARALGIPARLLGFDPPSAGSVTEDEEVRWVDRRDFINAVTAIILSVGAYPELERLKALFVAHGDSPVPQRIGATDVAAIEATTAAFRLSDRQYGGGLSHAAAVAHLGFVLKLREAQCSDQVRAELWLATADLATLAGWMSYDLEQHEQARRLWMIALDTAGQANHPRSTDLTAQILLDMADQALHLGRSDEALRLVQLGAVTATNGTYPVSASVRSYNAMVLAWCRASLGEVDPCRRALDQALQAYADADPASAPPWHFDICAAEIAGQHGHSLFLLSRTDPGYAPAAIEHLHAAVDHYGPTRARFRAVNLPGLAGSYFHAGAVDSAVLAGQEAVTAIGALSSKRAHARLRTLAELAEPHSHRSDVAELRERIRTALATVA